MKALSIWKGLTALFVLPVHSTVNMVTQKNSTFEGDESEKEPRCKENWNVSSESLIEHQMNRDSERWSIRAAQG